MYELASLLYWRNILLRGIHMSWWLISITVASVKHCHIQETCDEMWEMLLEIQFYELCVCGGSTSLDSPQPQEFFRSALVSSWFTSELMERNVKRFELSCNRIRKIVTCLCNHLYNMYQKPASPSPVKVQRWPDQAWMILGLLLLRSFLPTQWRHRGGNSFLECCKVITSSQPFLLFQFCHQVLFGGSAGGKSPLSSSYKESEKMGQLLGWRVDAGCPLPVCTPLHLTLWSRHFSPPHGRAGSAG